MFLSVERAKEEREPVEILRRGWWGGAMYVVILLLLPAIQDDQMADLKWIAKVISLDKDMKIINYFLFVSSSRRCVDHVIHKDGQSAKPRKQTRSNIYFFDGGF